MNHFAKQSSRQLNDECFTERIQLDSEFKALALDESAVTPANWIERLCRSRIVKRFGNIINGQIIVCDAEGEFPLGIHQSGDLQVRLSVFDPAMYRRTLLGGTIGSAESYMNGDWRTDNLTDLIRILIRNISCINTLDRTWSWLQNSWHRLIHLRRRNTIDGSRRNISQHYDLGNDFYQLFLDPTMNYSSGIFSADSQSMYESSLFKMERICQKLRLRPEDRVLEIGTGWGGLAIFMARQFGCRVTTTTISEAQYHYAKEAIERAGLSDRVTVMLEDYRNLSGQFDKLVSIEMIEAIGHQYFDQYFSKCSALLVDDGLMLLQGITMSQQNYLHHINNIDFIRRYIFPGGCLPSVVAIGQSVGRTSDMRMVHLEDITQHYVMTLQKWRSEFFRKIAHVRRLGYDDQFIRMWHFYLCYCEAAFAERRVNTVQVVLAKPRSNVDPANEYSAAGRDTRYELFSNQSQDSQDSARFDCASRDCRRPLEVVP